MAKISLAKPDSAPQGATAVVEQVAAPVVVETPNVSEHVTSAATPIEAPTVNGQPSTEEPKPEAPTEQPAADGQAPEKKEVVSSTKISFASAAPTAVDGGQSTVDNAPAPKPTISELLKDVPKDELYKFLELDEHTIKFNDFRKKGGNPYDYITQKAVDYTKISDEMLLKNKLKEQYPNLEADDVQVLYDDRYGQNDSDEENVNKKRAIIAKADAYEQRQKKIADQQASDMPVIPQPQQQGGNEYETAIKTLQKQNQEYYNYIVGDEVVKQFIADKKLKVDVGNGNYYTFEVENPQHLRDVLTNPKVSDQYGNNAQGKPDTQLMLEMALFKASPKQFRESFINYGKSLALLDELLKDGQNVSKPQGAAPRNGATTGNRKIVPTTGRIVQHG